MPSPQHKDYVFTLNNYTHLPNLCHVDIHYAVYQEEVGEKGTPHLQGYIEFTKRLTVAAIKREYKALRGAHFEPRKGPRDVARDYCRKEDTRKEGTLPYEYGVWRPVTQGSRTDINDLKQAIADRKSEKEIFEAFPDSYLKYARAIQQVRKFYTPKERDPPYVVFLYGPPGTGKSRFARAVDSTAYWLTAPPGKETQVWFDTYDGEATIVIDEFSGWMPYSFFLRLLDRYPLILPTKGSSVHLAANTFIITSNKLPSAWYHKLLSSGLGDIRAIHRRINLFVYCRFPYEEVEIPDDERYRQFHSSNEFLEFVERIEQ